MKYWIIPGNIDIFRVVDYFNDNNVVDWKQSQYKFEVGDIVFLYLSSPISSIRFMLEVVGTNITYEESIRDFEYWTHKHPMEKDVRHYKYVRLKLLQKSDNKALSSIELSKYNFSPPRGAIHNISKELLDYILSEF